EGVPVVLMEAMALEIPCIATRITGVPELINDGQSGLLVSPADTQELRAALGRLLNDPELRRRLGRAGREKVLRDYDIRTNVAQRAQRRPRVRASATDARAAPGLCGCAGARAFRQGYAGGSLRHRCAAVRGGGR